MENNPSVTDPVAASPPLSHGQACVTCTRAKCRCVPRSSGSGCQRCHRLNKECHPSARVRKPKPLSKKAQLEQQIDGLLSQLNNVKDSFLAKVDSNKNLAGQDPAAPALSNSAYNSSYNHAAATTTASPLAAPSVDNDIGLQSSVPTANDEEELLHSFRTEKLPFLPFIHIPPPNIKSAQQLKQESPFLWRCITAIQTKDRVRQTELVIELRRVAGQMLLVDCQKNLDILQGLLVYLAWITYQSQPQKSSFCVYSQLTIALVVELGLDKAPPPRGDPLSAKDSENVSLVVLHLRPPSSAVRSMDERRTVLCCFILTSYIAQFLGRMDPLRWTSHLTECLETLARSLETENDAVLVQLTRIRLVAEKIFQCSRLSDVETVPRAPPSFHIGAIQSDLEEFKRQIPLDLGDNLIVRLHLLHTEITLYAMALPTPSQVDHKRLDHLYACLVAVKEFLDVFVAMEPATYACFSTTHLCQTAHTFTTLFRLSVLDCPGWDLVAVRNMVDIVAIADKVSQRTRQASEATSNDSFIALATAIDMMRAVWAARVHTVAAEQDQTATADNPGGPSEAAAEVPSFAFHEAETDQQWFLGSFLGYTDSVWIPTDYDLGRYSVMDAQ